MGQGKTGMSCAQAKELDMVDYLYGLGHAPVKIRENDFWYFSPFREEKTPSFKINRKRNRWYDFGEGCGGNLIDFAIRYKGCTVGEFLNSLTALPSSFSTAAKTANRFPNNESVNPAISKIDILEVRSLYSNHLLHYLKDRSINLVVADEYCKEIKYAVRDKKYDAIGFENDKGGWELRHPNFKGSSSPKGLKSIISGKDTVCIFEGFMDFLSFHSIMGKQGTDYDFVVLNSLSFFPNIKLLTEKHRHILLFLDNDNAGKKYAALACAEDDRYEDKSDWYRNHKDLNDYLRMR